VYGGNEVRRNVSQLPRPIIRSVIVILLIACATWPVTLSADQAQYFYDELGRLVAVVDGQGNAVYNYDAVGNLLSIQRFTTGTTGIGIFVIAPASGKVGSNVTIRGFGFSPTATDNQVTFNGIPAAVVSARFTGSSHHTSLFRSFRGINLQPHQPAECSDYCCYA
jgi:YD repeat-containing protein